MSPAIHHIKTPEDIETLSQLAHRIWQEHYPAIIGQAQVDYMLKKFYDPAYLSQRIQAGSEYYFIQIFDQGKNRQNAGYFAITPQDGEKLFLNKMYLDQAFRGKGLFRYAMTEITHRAKVLNRQTLWLTVNKHNTKAIGAYQALGFSKAGEQTVDIGGGFVMDDDIYTLPLVS